MNLIVRNQILSAVEQILHVPGNFAGGILEMTVVLDDTLDIEKQKNMISDTMKCLKGHSETFRNVRLNLVQWHNLTRPDELPTSIVIPMTMLIMGRLPEEGQNCAQNQTEGTPGRNGSKTDVLQLMEYLKKFHSRSKLILIFSGSDFEENIERDGVLQAMQPFLQKKVILITNGDKKEKGVIRHQIAVPD